MKLSISLRLRFLLLSFLLLALLVGGYSLYFNAALRTSITSNRQAQQVGEANRVAGEVASRLHSGTTCSELQIFISQFSQVLVRNISIILPDSRVCAESFTGEPFPDGWITQEMIQDTLAGEKSSVVFYDDLLQENLFLIAVPITSESEVIGALFMTEVTTQLDADLRTYWYCIANALILSALLVIILVIFLEPWVFKPIRRLTGEIMEMGTSSPADTIIHYKVNEVDQLRLAFNRLISHQNQQIEDLKVERVKLDAVLSYMTDGIMIVDRDGIIQLINPAAREMFGVTKPITGEQTLIEVIRHHQVIDVWQQCREKNTQETTTLETFPDRLFIQVIAIPIHQVIPGATLLLLQDLTRVRRLETVRRDFVSNVSHELRTPLASLKALVETLADGALKEPSVAERFLQRMDTEIDNLSQLVEELLELTRIESSRVPLEKKEVAPLELAASAVERMQTQAERAGLSIHIDVSGNLPAVHADPKRLQQLLINLLHNAIKFTPPGGEIHVSAREDEQNNITFSIQDTGTGIPEQYLGRIFERFYKADRARSGGGTGLGLSIARHLVEAHSGKIWAINNPDKGSTFFFTLPKA